MKKSLLDNILLVVFCLLIVSEAAQSCPVDPTIIATGPNSRYTNNGNGIVTDDKTKLMWKQCSEGFSSLTNACDTGTAIQYTWQGAQQLVQNVNLNGGFAGYSDWRMPNIKELTSLVERMCKNPSINDSLFPKTMASDYWSSSPSYPFPYTWFVDFYWGEIKNFGAKNNAMYVRLVRGG